MNALRLYCKATDKTLNDLSKLGQGMTLEDSIQLIGAGLQDGHRKAGKEYKLTIEDIADFLDDDMNINESKMTFKKKFDMGCCNSNFTNDEGCYCAKDGIPEIIKNRGGNNSLTSFK